VFIGLFRVAGAGECFDDPRVVLVSLQGLALCVPVLVVQVPDERNQDLRDPLSVDALFE
jgi:hypothetical protein